MKTENQIKLTPRIASRRNLTARTAVALLAFATATIPVLAGDASAPANKKDSDTIRPFHIHVSDEALTDLRRRINAAQAQNTSPQPTDKIGTMMTGAGTATNNQEIPKVIVTEIPPEYRDWKLISVAREEGALDDIRAILGNDIAIKAYREGTLPFPEGAIIVRIAWSYDASEENNKTFGKAQSFVAGRSKNGVQFMVKDSNKYASTGGWGYGQFDDGKAASASMLQSCYPCHKVIKERDFIFTRYAP